MTPAQRDQPRTQLFDEHLGRAGNQHQALEATATRTESQGLREVLAYGASHGRLTLEQLTAAIMAAESVPVDPQRLASLARVCALQDFDPDDRPFAIAALARANSALPEGKATLRYRLLEAQLLLEAGDLDRVVHLLDNTLELRGHPELTADLANPFTESPYADAAAWATSFNHRLVSRGHEPVTVTPGPGQPFDRLHAAAPPAATSGLVSVIMTTYRPDRHAILGSAKSILDQSWQDLELIVIDDGSPTDFDSVLSEVAALDQRVQMYRLAHNQGTYGARNYGLTKSRGVYVTGQDDDDWSHPRRLELQAQALDDSPGVPGVRLAALAAHPDLTRSRPGYGYTGDNSSSLMFRRRWLDDMGGYFPVRKAADNEFHRRLEAVSGQQVKLLPDPLTIIRAAPGSLSRGDYRPGWSHPARRSFRSAYTLWHAESSDLRVDPRVPPPIPVPHRLGGAARQDLDVVFAGDWRRCGPDQRSMLAEIAALRGRGLRVGVLHLEAAYVITEDTEPLCAPVQRLINSGGVTEVLVDDEASVRLLVLRSPPILQFATRRESRLRVDRLIILADQPPSERDGTDVRYRTADCTRNARDLFGVEPLWVPQGPVVRGTLTPLIPADHLAGFDLPGIVNLDDWLAPRGVFRSTVPVIGRISSDRSMRWPSDPEMLRAVYPTDGSVDVRVMGGGRTAREVLGTRHDSAAWLVLETEELPVRTFLSSIDYFVQYQHPSAYGAFGRETLEAIATGCVAVLPHFLEPTFGGAAVYASAEDAVPLVHELYNDPAAHWEQVARASRVLRDRFSETVYADRVASLLDQPAIVGH